MATSAGLLVLHRCRRRWNTAAQLQDSMTAYAAGCMHLNTDVLYLGPAAFLSFAMQYVLN